MKFHKNQHYPRNTQNYTTKEAQRARFYQSPHDLLETLFGTEPRRLVSSCPTLFTHHTMTHRLQRVALCGSTSTTKSAHHKATPESRPIRHHANLRICETPRTKNTSQHTHVKAVDLHQKVNRCFSNSRSGLSLTLQRRSADWGRTRKVSAPIVGPRRGLRTGNAAYRFGGNYHEDLV